MDHEHLLSDEKATTVSEDDEQPTQQSFRRKYHQRFGSTLFPWTAIIIHAGTFATYTILLSLYAAWIRKTSGTRSPVAYGEYILICLR
jgi:heme/copper-type cytochrome/quinol oxidase subunit 3